MHFYENSSLNVSIFVPREKGSTITSVLSSATSLGMSFPIRLNSVPLRTLITFPFLLAMLSTKVLLDSRQVPKSPQWIMMNTACFWTHINFLPYNLFVSSLLQFPWQIVPSFVKLKILISLKPLAADLAYESIRRHQRLRR